MIDRLSDEESDWEMLKLANDKGMFGLEMGMPMCAHLNDSFDRGIEHNWWSLVDFRIIPANGSILPMRVFKLTSYGVARKAQLEKKFTTPATH